MTDVIDTHPAPMDEQVVDGGGTAPPESVVDPVAEAIARLEILDEPTRNAVLDRMDPAIAERIRQRIATTDPKSGSFHADVVAKRQRLREMSERLHATNAMRQQEISNEQTAAAARPAGSAVPVAPAAPVAPALGGAPAPVAAAMPMLHEDPLDQLRVLHPAAIARAMQGERAEAWAIVLDRLDVNSRGALQVYLEAPARAAIEDARARQSDLRATAPQLLETIEAAIARTVVPRAMREHHHLLSTTPPSWDAAGSGMGGSWQHA